MTIERLLARWPDAAVGAVNAFSRNPVSGKLGGFHNWPEPVRQLNEGEVWAVVPGSMGFVVFDVDRDHDLASRLLVGEFGEPAAKVKSHQKGFHFWYPSKGNIDNSDWLCGEIRGTNGYLILWHLDELLAQLEGHNCIRSLNLAEIREVTSLKTRPKTKIETMLGHVSADDYGTWISVGIALKSELGDDGLGTWEEWSRGSDKFKQGECGKKWRGFSQEGRVTLGTLYFLACEGGYQPRGGRPPTASGTVPPLDRIVRVGTGAETTWEFTVGDTTVKVSQAELCTQARFRTIWHAAMGVIVRVKQADWDKALTEWWQRAEVVDAPSLDSVIWAHLEDFCTDSPAMEKEELINGLSYTEDDITWFKITNLYSYLASRRVNVPVQRIWGAIRVHTAPIRKTINVKGKTLRVCGVPAFDQQDSEFSVPEVASAGDF